MDFRDDSTISFLCGLATGLAVGAAAMFILDPEQGRRRRAIARDKIIRYGSGASDFATSAAKDLRNRAYGVAAETRGAVNDVLGQKSEEAKPL
jgi:gas vesicle protein